MKDFAVQFASGREVLSAYWGYLSDGGLVIDDGSALEVGDAVTLTVDVASSNKSYHMTGKVVRRQPVDGHVVIAFNPGQPHDLLLSSALAETDNVPARRHRRYRIHLDAVVTGEGAETDGVLVNISREGCCVHLASAGAATVGSSISIAAGSFTVDGEVMWQRNRERGVRFAADRAGASLKLLHEYLQKLD